MKAWHFVGETLRDGRPVPPDGEWLEHEGSLIMCESGLHASRRLIDALKYAPGATICRVEFDSDDYIEEEDKLVSRRRMIIWRIDGESVLRAFARWCALQVVHLWDAPDVVIEYLTTGNEETRDAAWDAARDAAWDAAWAAARDAAWAAARDAARAAAWDKQNAQLEAMAQEARNGKTEWIFEVPERTL
jgi:hypothetical protein